MATGHPAKSGRRPAVEGGGRVDHSLVRGRQVASVLASVDWFGGRALLRDLGKGFFERLRLRQVLVFIGLVRGYALHGLDVLRR